MLSYFNCRLSSLDDILSRQSHVIAQLQLAAWIRRNKSPPRMTSATASNDEVAGLEQLHCWIHRLSVQLARTHRRVEGLRVQLETHDAKLTDLISRTVTTSGGRTVVRPYVCWTSSRLTVDSPGSTQRRHDSSHPATTFNASSSGTLSDRTGLGVNARQQADWSRDRLQVDSATTPDYLSQTAGYVCSLNISVKHLNQNLITSSEDCICVSKSILFNRNLYSDDEDNRGIQ